jgi:hypothetical protein
MAFIQKQGYWYSENGWRMCDINECDRMEIPGTGLRLWFRKGEANDIMRAWLSWFNANVENLNNPGRGYSDEGSYTDHNDVGNSNHNSATAADLNWSEHAFRVSYSGFTSAEIARVREGLRLFTYKGQQLIWWGQDWGSPKDPMHFQLNLAESNKLNREFADKLLGGYLGIFGKDSGPIVTVPLPDPAVPGVDILRYGSHGEAVLILQRGMNAVFKGYPQMPLAVDGDFGPMTESAVKLFQSRSGLDPDGEVGPLTRKELLKYNIKV